MANTGKVVNLQADTHALLKKLVQRSGKSADLVVHRALKRLDAETQGESGEDRAARQRAEREAWVNS